MSTIDGTIGQMSEVFDAVGVKFMIRKFERGHEIQEQNQGIISFDSENIVAHDLTYQEAVALLRILEGDKYE